MGGAEENVLRRDNTGEEAQETALEGGIRQYAYFCIDNFRGNSYSRRSLFGALRKNKQRFEPNRARKMLQVCLEKIELDNRETEKRKEGATNMLKKLNQETGADRNKRRASPNTTTLHTIYNQCPVEGFAGPVLSSRNQVAPSAEPGFKGHKCRDTSDSLSAERSSTSEPQQAEFHTAPRASSGKGVPPPGSSRKLRTMSPNARHELGMSMIPPAFASERSTTTLRRALQTKSPNVAFSSDAFCNIGSPLLSARDGGVQKDGFETGTAVGHLSGTEASLVRRSNNEGRSMSMSKRERENDVDMALEPPAKRKFKQFFEAWGTVFQLQAEFPDLSAQLSELLRSSRPFGHPTDKEAANGERDTPPSDPPLPKVQTQKAAVLPKQPSLKSAQALLPHPAPTGPLGAKYAAPGCASVTPSNGESEAKQAEPASIPLLEATRAGGEKESGKHDGATIGKKMGHAATGVGSGSEPKSLVDNLQTPRSQSSLPNQKTANPLHMPASSLKVVVECRPVSQADAETQDAGHGCFEGLGGQEKDALDEAGAKANSKLRVKMQKKPEKPAGEGDAQNECPVASTSEALAAIQLVDHAELASVPPPSKSKGAQDVCDPLLAASAVLKRRGEGALFAQKKEGSGVSFPGKVNASASSLAALCRESAMATGSGVSNVEEAGPKPRQKWTNPLFQPLRQSMDGKEHEEEDAPGLDQSCPKSGQGNRSSEEYEGSLTGLKESTRELRGGAFGSAVFFNNEEEEKELLFAQGMVSSGTNRGESMKRGSVTRTASAALYATGNSNDGGEKPSGEKSFEEKGDSSPKQQRYEAMALSIEHGRFVDGRVLFGEGGDEEGQPFASFDRTLAGIQANTDYTFGLGSPQDSPEGFFDLHPASPTGLGQHPLVPRALLFRNPRPAEVTASVPKLQTRFGRAISEERLRINESAPQFTFQKLGRNEEEGDEEELGALEIGHMKEESAGGRETDWESVHRAARGSGVVLEENAARNWGDEDDLDSPNMTEKSESQEGRPLRAFATKEGQSRGQTMPGDVSTDVEGQEKERAKGSVDRKVGRYGKYQESPFSCEKSGDGQGLGCLTLSRKSLGDQLKGGLGGRTQSALGKVRDAGKEALAEYESESFGVTRIAGSLDGSGYEYDTALIAEIAKLIQKEELSPNGSTRSSGKCSGEEDEMSISAYGQGGEKSDEEEDSGESVNRAFGRVQPERRRLMQENYLDGCKDEDLLRHAGS